MKDLTTLKPNELIRLAIADMKTTIAQGHSIDMSRWGRDVGGPNCSVCFAGSIMLQQGKTPNEDNEFETSSTKDINDSVFRALDNIRQGNLNAFCDYLNVVNPLVVKFGLPINEFDIEYEEGEEEEFYTYMENIAKLFD